MSITLKRSKNPINCFVYLFYNWGIVHIQYYVRVRYAMQWSHCDLVFFIHLSVDGYLVCFHILVILNDATGNMGVWYLFELFLLDFSEVYPGVKLPDHMVVLFSVFRETCILFSIVAAPVYHGFMFSTSSPTLDICVHFHRSHSDQC